MSYYSEVIADSPAAYYRLDNSAGFTVDASGNARTLTANGANFTARASLVASDSTNGACEYDNQTATGTHTSADSVFKRTGTGAFTLSFLCKFTTIDTDYRRLVSFTDDASGSQNAFAVQYQSSAGFLATRWTAGAGAGPNGSPSVYDTSTAYHVWMEYTGSNIELWVNNVQMGSTTADTGSQGAYAGSFSIGAGQFGSTSAKAIIDEVAFFTSALGATRRAAHYNAAVSSGVMLMPLLGVA